MNNPWFRSSRSNTQGWHLSRHLLFWGACASILWSVVFAIVTLSFPYPIELREGTAQVMTDLLLSLENPFVLENQPLAMNNYGLGYSLAVVPFAALFGNTLQVHRSITFLFILLASLTGFIVIQKTKRDVASACACAAFIMIGLMARGGIGAFPSAMGTFLFLLTIVVPFLKRFNRTSLVFSVLFAISAFYTKAYFLLGVGIVASYLFLFRSKETGILYGVLFLILFVVSFCIVRLAFPLYFINTIIGNASNTDRSIEHLLSQLKQLLLYFFPVLLSTLLQLLTEKGMRKHRALPALDVRNWNQPLISVTPNYFLYSSAIALLVFVFFLGLHIGSYLNYAYQLVLPIFFCWFFLKFDLQRRTGLLVAVAVIFNLLFWGTDVLSPQKLEQNTSKEWNSLYSYVRSSSNVLNSPVITSAMIEMDLNPLDSGQTSYFYAVKPYLNNAVLGPSYESFQSDGFKYVKFIDNSIEKQRFDLIVTTREESAFYHAKLIEKFYSRVAEIKVDMPQTEQEWTLILWKPMVP